jgi:hypothetical protein
MHKGQRDLVIAAQKPIPGLRAASMINRYFISHDRFPNAAIPTVTHESAVLDTSKTGG